MTDTSIYQSTLRRGSVSESDTEPLNSTVNPWGNPSQYIPLIYPNISDPDLLMNRNILARVHVYSPNRRELETRITKIKEFFHS